MDLQSRPDGDSTVSSPDQPRPSSPQPDLGHQPGSPRLPQPVCEDLSDRPSDPLHASLGTRSTDVEASASSPLAGDRAPEPDRSGGGKLDEGQHGHSGISAARTSYVPQDHLQPQLASGGYNCSKAPKMESAVTCISSLLITARYICLLLWHFLISSCNQQQQLPGTTAAPACSHYVTSSTKQQLQLSSYNCSQLRRPPQSSSYTC